MKLVRTVTLGTLALGLVALGYVGVTACSSSTSTSSPSTVGAAPKKPSAGATVSTAEHNYALHALFLGDTDRTGSANTAAWKKFGYNIDGKITDKTSTDVCKSPGGLSTQVDGDDGIDNAFGAIIVPLIGQLQHDVSKFLTSSIQQGNFTIMLDTVGLSDDPKQTATGLSGQLFGGAALANPTFTTADKWPIRPDGLNGSDVKSGSTVKWSDAFVLDGTWVSGAPSDVKINLSLNGVSLELKVHQAVLSFQHSGTNADNGLIAGVINTQELITSLRKVASSISTQLCSGSAFDTLASQITKASDILTDGTNRAGVDCDGISIGIGFEGKEIAPPTTVAAPTGPVPDPCSDAGAPADAGGNDDGSAQDAGQDASHD